MNSNPTLEQAARALDHQLRRRSLPFDATPLETAEYVADMAKELAQLAAAAGLDLVAHCLSVASAEAHARSQDLAARDA